MDAFPYSCGMLFYSLSASTMSQNAHTTYQMGLLDGITRLTDHRPLSGPVILAHYAH